MPEEFQASGLDSIEGLAADLWQPIKATQELNIFQRVRQEFNDSLGVVGRLIPVQEPDMDWDWAMRILRQRVQPEIRQFLNSYLEDIHASQSSSLESQKILSSKYRQPEILNPQQPIGAIFDRKEVREKLLILGETGSGKTGLLLQLANELVERALARPRTMIPIVFDLSTWRSDTQSFTTWLIDHLYENFGGRQREIYRPWLYKKVLLPLLDGLDELPEKEQQNCIAQINQFASEYPQLVVCARKKSLRQRETSLEYLRGVVQLQPLSDEQIRQYLVTVGKLGLWLQLQDDPEMRSLLNPPRQNLRQSLNINKLPDQPEETAIDVGLLRSPLFLKWAALSYEPGQPLRSKAEIIDQYIDRQISHEVRALDRRRALNHYPWAFKDWELEPDWREVRKSLSWLAGQLQKHHQVELLIEKMQPSWLAVKQEKWWYQITRLLILGLIMALLCVLLFRISDAIGPGVNSFFILNLTLSLVMGRILRPIVVVNASLKQINPIESFRILMLSKERELVLHRFKKILVFGVAISLALGLIVGLSLGFFNALAVALFFGLNKLMPQLSDGLIQVLQIIWYVGLLVGLFLYPMVMSLGVPIFELKDLKMRSKPNQGIWNSLRSVCWIIISFCALAFILLLAEITNCSTHERGFCTSLSTVFFNWISHFLFLIFFGLVFALLLGGIASIQHFCLRLILAFKARKTPWNYARFLDYCVERRLLQRVGGRYRFIHQELLDYFAANTR